MLELDGVSTASRECAFRLHATEQVTARMVLPSQITRAQARCHGAVVIHVECSSLYVLSNTLMPILFPYQIRLIGNNQLVCFIHDVISCDSFYLK